MTDMIAVRKSFGLAMIVAAALGAGYAAASLARRPFHSGSVGNQVQ